MVARTIFYCRTVCDRVMEAVNPTAAPSLRNRQHRACIESSNSLSAQWGSEPTAAAARIRIAYLGMDVNPPPYPLWALTLTTPCNHGSREIPWDTLIADTQNEIGPIAERRPLVMANPAYYESLDSRLLGPESPNVHEKYTPSTGPIFSSPYGPFPPSDPNLNIHEYCFPPENPVPPEDYDLFINAYTEEKISIHQFYDKVRSLARVLRHDGPNPLGLGRSPQHDREDGEIIGICSRNNLSWPVIAHACFRSELVFGSISPASTSYELWHVMRKMQITSMIVNESLLPVLQDAIKFGRNPSDGGLGFVMDPKKIIVLSENASLDEVAGFPTVEGLIRKGRTMEEPKRKISGGNKLCFMFQSSGTSGLPKAMMITHSNAVAIGQQTMIDGRRIGEFVGPLFL